LWTVMDYLKHGKFLNNHIDKILKHDLNINKLLRSKV
jgi:hypothetical protein